ncbi:MAG: MFS transporter, partial [Chloroflexota bacterium]|nr:MFS transporter [Chloroflexota bacterium]
MSDQESSNITTHIPEAGQYRWVVFGMFVACNTSGFLIANTIGILLPAISQDIGISPTQQGMLSSAPFWANLTLMVVVSWWTSRYPPKILVTVTMILGALSLFFQGWGPAFVWLMLGRLAFGVTMIAREPARSLLIRQWLPQREVNISGGVSNLFFGLIVSGGLLLTPVLLRAYGGDWRAVMNTFGMVFIALGVAWILLGRERDSDATQSVTKTGAGQSDGEYSIVKMAFGFREVWVAGLGFTGALMSFA